MGPCCRCQHPQVLQPEKRRRSRSEDDRTGPRGQVIGVIEGCGEDSLSQILGPLLIEMVHFLRKTQEIKVHNTLLSIFHSPLGGQAKQAGGNELSFGENVGQLR